MNRFAPIAVFCLMIGAAGPALGEMYYWTDENGIRHYSNHVPPSDGTEYGSASEVDYDAERDMQRSERDARSAGEMKEAREAEAAEAARKEAEAEKRATAGELEKRKDQQQAVEEKLYDKRRASTSRMQKAIDNVAKIDERVAELEKTGGNEEEIAALKAQRKAVVEQLYENSRRWKRGGQADLKEHKELQKQIDALEQKE
ncbi:MAG: DUF4124 domain-containing protein [Desulfobacterales bacterium]|jgi:hypothetical protein